MNNPAGFGRIQPINELLTQQQREICGAMKPPVVKNQAQNATNQPRIYQVNEGEEEEVFMTSDLDRISLSGSKDHTSMIIDTGSAYNLIGEHLIPMLEQKLTEAGIETQIIPTKKKFQFGGRTIVESSGKIKVPLILGKTKIDAKIDLDLLPSGHMGLKWDVNLHKRKPSQIYQATKTSVEKNCQKSNLGINTAEKIGFEENSQENETHTSR